MRKVCVVITARPSYSRVKSVLIELSKRPSIKLFIVATASALVSKYGNAVEFIEKDGFSVDEKIFTEFEGSFEGRAAKTTGHGIIELSTTFRRLKPDLVLTVADRYETMATAIAASYMNIPLAHLQGGEKTGNIDEKVRHAITKLSDIHFVSTKLAYDRVVKMGEEKTRVFLTGCPSIDIACEVKSEEKMGFNPFEKYGGVGAVFNALEPYLVVIQHPVTTETSFAFDQIMSTITAIESYGMNTFMFWPNSDEGTTGISKAIRLRREEGGLENVHFFRNLSSKDFLQLINNCRCLIGNSSVGIREACYLGVPVVNIGTRQSGRERGDNVLDVSYDPQKIRSAIEFQVENGNYEHSNLYGDGESGKRIAEIIETIDLTTTKLLSY